MQRQKLVTSIVAIGLLSFLGIVIETSLNIAFPMLMREFSLSASTVQWLTTGYMLVATILIPFGSFLRRRFRALNIFRVAVVSFLIGTGCAGLAAGFPMILFGRLLEGIADGLCLPLMFSIILEQAPKKAVGTFMGIGSLVIAFAPAVGPVYGGLVLKYWSWHQLFWLIMPVIILTWLLGEVSITQVKKPEHLPFDLQGGALLAVLLTATLLLVVSVTSSGTNWLWQLLLLIIAVISLMLFIKYEQSKAVKLLDLSLFKRPTFVTFLSAFFLLQLLSLAMSYLIPNVLQLAFKESTAATGLLVLPAAFVDAVLSAVAGLIYDRVSHRLPIIVGTGIIVLTFGLANILTPSVILLAVMYVMFMIGLGLSYSNIMTLSLAQLPESVVDDGNAIYMTAQSYSGAIGTALAASLLTMTQKGDAALAVGTLQGLKLNLAVFLLLALVVFFLCIKSVSKLKK
ncbi:MFS transporter [Lactobacillus sp. ESL0731]|uniref:MFS transporter n=1 Tax=unclassified Lactobacillus TaxID=2620435 RepID=UPI0023F67D83|nr:MULTISPECIES: MFS transporter [unclassified Lactobacillus]WEV50848.1 MFS transporter [Lactobacillus sp. ESL0700]WEV61979.1 MFS transporter [Lactobacillus sp. ESL0731]